MYIYKEYLCMNIVDTYWKKIHIERSNKNIKENTPFHPRTFKSLNFE